VKYREIAHQRELDRIESERQLKEKEQERVLAAQEAERLQKLKEAERQRDESRRLADEMRFYAAMPEPAGDRAPAFYDQESAEGKGRAALKVAQAWGPTLNDLPLVEDRPTLKRELYDLLLLMAQVRGRRATDAASAKDMLVFLDQAATMKEPSSGYHQLRARYHQLQ